MTADELAQRARDILTEQPETELLTLEKMKGLIPTAVKLVIASLPSKRAVRFRKESTPVEITAGVADISALVAAGLLADKLESSDIIVTTGGIQQTETVQFVFSYDRLALGGIQDKFFILAYLDGDNLRFRNPADGLVNSLAGDLIIRGLYAPSDVTLLPADMDADLVLMLADIAKREIGMQQPRTRSKQPEETQAQ